MFVYYFRSESDDSYMVATETKYESVSDFMMNEAYGEYEAWKSEGYEDDDIPYAEYQVLDTTKENSIYF